MAEAERHEEVWYDLTKISQREKDALIWFYNSSCRDLWDKLPNGPEDHHNVRIVAELLRELDSKETGPGFGDRHDDLRHMSMPRVSQTYNAQ